MNKNDKRYIRTHGKIRREFEALILEKDFGDMTVSELAARSVINRKTFYLHFASLEDVIEELQADIMAELAELADLGGAPVDPSRSEEIIVRFADILSRNRPLHRRLFCSGSYRFVFEGIRGAMMARYAAALGKRSGFDEERLGLFLDFVSYGTLFVFRDWLSADKPGSPDELARLVGRLAKGAAEGFAALGGERSGP